ncbi:hypothetical protein GOBAR_DD02184 [Gossypium barbadense]|nr:hypothetical protein GOBAR_DD02184 [Gossypium barbadense]
MGLDRMCKEFALLSLKLTIIAIWVAAQPKPECQSNCGDINIAYPFGTGNGCNISSNFFIRCDTTSNPPKAFLNSTDIEVLHISLDVHMASHIHFQTSPYLIPETSSQPLVVIPMLSLRGNPYLSYGCQDINKCKTLKPCNETATCDNVAGSYYCSCPEGFEADGQKNGKGCSPKVKSHQSFPTLLVALGWLEHLSRYKEYGETAKLFTIELNKATNNYHESRILGQGSQGTVYKGLLPDGRSIATKKSIIGDQSQVQQFVNDVIVLSKSTTEMW